MDDFDVKISYVDGMVDFDISTESTEMLIEFLAQVVSQVMLEIDDIDHNKATKFFSSALKEYLVQMSEPETDNGNIVWEGISDKEKTKH